MLLARELTERVIGLAIEVHRLTGPGMLESVYEGCLCHELEQAQRCSSITERRVVATGQGLPLISTFAPALTVVDGILGFLA